MSNNKAYNGPEYPTEAHGSIPVFNSYEEEAHFWDTHSITDFAAETEPVKVRSTRGLSANELPTHISKPPTASREPRSRPPAPL